MDDKELFNGLKQGDRKAFSDLFRKYYADLCLFAGRFLGSQEAAEDVVQSVFLKLWAERSRIVVRTSFRSFLLRSIQNSCLDELKHAEVIRGHQEQVLSTDVLEEVDVENYVLYSDLASHLSVAIDQLPPSYREAFLLSRREGLKYKEIAEQLGVSERVVEVRIGKALVLLREHLKEFLLVLLLYLACK